MKNRHDVLRGMAYISGGTIRDAGIYLDSFCEYLADALAKGEKINLQGIMSIKIEPTKAKKGRNIHTKEQIDIPEGKRIKVTFSEIFKNKVGVK